MNKQEFESIPNHLPIDWEAEKQKCIESPYYFFTNYCTIDGQKCTTPLSEEEFNKQALMPNNGETFYHNPTPAEIDEAIKLTKELSKPIVSTGGMFNLPESTKIEFSVSPPHRHRGYGSSRRSYKTCG